MLRELRVVVLLSTMLGGLGAPTFAQEAPGAGAEPDGVQGAVSHLMASTPEAPAPAQVQLPRPQQEVRPWLERHGVTIGSVYVAEAFGWLRTPGKRSQYLGSYAPNLTLDLAAMNAGRGQIYVGAQVLRRGTPGVETLQAVSNMEAPAFDKVAEAWYGDSYLERRLALKAGLHFADAEFGTVDAGASFLNASYGAIPTTPMPAYPDAALGVTSSVTPRPWISIAAGMFRGAAVEGEAGSATRMGPFGIVEARLAPFGARSRVRVGAWRQAPGRDERNAGTATGINHGLYATAERRFGTVDATAEEPAWALFLQWGWAPADRNDMSGYVGGGVTRRGPLSARPDDEIGAGVTSAVRAEGERETGLELFYRLRLRNDLFVQPDVQWIRRPAHQGGGAFVAGLRVSLEL